MLTFGIVFVQGFFGFISVKETVFKFKEFLASRFQLDPKVISE